MWLEAIKVGVHQVVTQWMSVVIWPSLITLANFDCNVGESWRQWASLVTFGNNPRVTEASSAEIWIPNFRASSTACIWNAETFSLTSVTLPLSVWLSAATKSINSSSMSCSVGSGSGTMKSLSLVTSCTGVSTCFPRFLGLGLTTGAMGNFFCFGWWKKNDINTYKYNE